MENFNPTPKKSEDTGPKKSNVVKNALMGILALGLSHSADAQKNNNNSLDSNKNKIDYVKDKAINLNKKETVSFYKDSITEADIQNAYNKNKEINDENFSNAILSIPSLLQNEEVWIKSSGINDISEAVVIHSNKDSVIDREEFESLEEFVIKYPQYKDQVFVVLKEAYAKHVNQEGWRTIITEQEDSLLNNFEDYIPSHEEIDILKKAAEVKNSGGVTDGYDEIYHYYVDKFSTPEGADKYYFEIEHNGTPGNLAAYMVNKYYEPLLKLK